VTPGCYVNDLLLNIRIETLPFRTFSYLGISVIWHMAISVLPGNVLGCISVDLRSHQEDRSQVMI
jgi:hypothetical protein